MEYANIVGRFLHIAVLLALIVYQGRLIKEQKEGKTRGADEDKRAAFDDMIEVVVLAVLFFGSSSLRLRYPSVFLVVGALFILFLLWRIWMQGRMIFIMRHRLEELEEQVNFFEEKYNTLKKVHEERRTRP